MSRPSVTVSHLNSCNCTSRQEVIGGSRKACKVGTYSLSTGTSSLCKHLFDHHAEAWVTACDDMKIGITAKGFVNKVDSYHRGRSSLSSRANQHEKQSRHPFSQEAFVDAIAEFIVGDDQVCLFHYSRLLQRLIVTMLGNQCYREPALTCNLPHALRGAEGGGHSSSHNCTCSYHESMGRASQGALQGV